MSSKEKGEGDKKATLHKDKDKERESSHSPQEEKSKHSKKPSELQAPNDKIKNLSNSANIEKQSPEVRHRGSSGSTTPVSTSNSPVLLEKEGQNDDLIDQMSFEEYEPLLQSKEVQNESLEGVKIPSNTVEVVDEVRVRKIAKPTLPPELVGSPSYINEAFALFSREWKMVKGLSSLASTVEPELSSKPTTELPDLVYEIDILRDLPVPPMKEPLDQEILLPITPKSRLANSEKMQSNRQLLFQVYPIDEPPRIERFRPGEPPGEFVSKQIHINFGDFVMSLGEAEPFFLTAFVYDIKTNRIVTEFFNFDVNPDATRFLLGQGPENISQADEPIMKCRQCIFSVKSPGPLMYLVIYVTKVATGDPDEAMEPYFKHAQTKPKERAKFLSDVRESVQRLAQFRQSIAWGAIEIFNHKGEIITPLNVPIKIANFSRNKTDLETYLNRISNEKELKKMQLLPCELTLTIKEISTPTDLPPFSLNPSLSPILTTAPNGNPNQITREILEFEDPQHPFHFISLDYTNILYIYPKKLNFNNYKSDGKATSARNLCVEVRFMEDDSNVNNPGLRAIYGNSTTPPFTTHAFTQVVYHNKRAKFLDEIKIQLPPKLTPNHHILFTFYHVSCKAPKKAKSGERPETPLGYAAVKLLSPTGCILKDDKYTIPVALVYPPKYLDQANQEALGKWVDNKKEVFKFKSKIVSTVFPQDQNLSSLFSVDNNSLVSVLTSIHMIPNHLKVRNLPIILGILFRFLTSSPPEIAKLSLSAISSIINGVWYESQGDILDSYVTYLFDTSPSWPTPLHVALLTCWIAHLEEKHESLKEMIKHAWFFMRIVLKSMVLEASSKGLLNDEKTRKTRFATVFPLISQLLRCLALEVQRFSKQNFSLAKSLTSQVGLFVRGLLDIMDRGQVFKLIWQYVEDIHPSGWSMELVVFKFDFLRTVVDHPHYIALNLPVFQTIPPIAEIFPKFLKRHFLSSLLIFHVNTAIIAPERDIRSKAIFTLRSILWKHDHTPALQVPEMHARVCALYFPYLLVVIDHFSETIEKWPAAEARDWLLCFISILSGMPSRLRSDWWRKETQKRKLILFSVFLKCIEVFEYPGKDESKGYGSFSVPSTPINSPIDMARGNSFQRDSSEMLSPILEDDGKKGTGTGSIKQQPPFFKNQKALKPTILPTGSMNREDTKNFLESYYKSKGESSSVTSPTPESRSASGSVSNATGNYYTQHSHRTSVSASTDSLSGSKIVSRPSLTSMYQTITTKSISNAPPEALARLHANLSSEVSFIVLSSIMQFISDHVSELTKHGSLYVDPIFACIVALLNNSQSIAFLHVLLRTLPEIISDFRAPLFRYNTTICGELCHSLLRHCLDRTPTSRAMSSSLLYLMIDQNYKETLNFTRMKLQTTIAISKIVGETQIQDREYEALMSCLDTIAKHVKTNHSSTKTNDTSSQMTLSQQMDEMKEKLFSVIKDSIKIRQFSYDPEMIADLTYQISNGFSESPDLRVTWLTNLVKIHKDAKNWEEAAQTSIITAALVSEYLKLLKRFPNRRDIKETNFKRSFPNFDREGSIPESTKASISTISSEICQTKVFSEQGYIDLMRDAIVCLKKGDLYEHSVQAYKLLLPVYERGRNWVKQAEAHYDLSVLCHKVIEENKQSARLFSNYYRVAFFGKLFGDLDSQEFVYKEPNYVRLADFSDRMKSQYDSKFGSDRTIILPNTKPVDPKQLDPSKAYLQIISVDPFLTPSQLAERPTPIEQNFNIDAFIFEVPFTKAGKAQGDMAEQFKRKTILRVEAAFPYLKKRLKIVEKREVEIVPIVNATEIIESKTNALRSELSSGLPNTKTLQINLQGCLLLQVNAGPIEICRVFLGESKTKYSSDQVAKLTQALQEFTQVIAQAVQLNGQLIENKDNQIQLQQQLELGLQDFKTKMYEYVTPLSPSEDSSLSTSA